MCWAAGRALSRKFPFQAGWESAAQIRLNTHQAFSMILPPAFRPAASWVCQEATRLRLTNLTAQAELGMTSTARRCR